MKQRYKKIEDELYRRLGLLEKLKYDELKALDGHPIKETIKIDGNDFVFSSWSERAVDETEEVLAVLVDTWKNNFVWSIRYMKGFLFSERGYIRELNEDELLEYD